jgi:hypothetical protein
MSPETISRHLKSRSKEKMSPETTSCRLKSRLKVEKSPENNKKSAENSTMKITIKTNKYYSRESIDQDTESSTSSESSEGTLDLAVFFF